MIVLDTNVVSELMRTRPEPGVVRWVDHHSPDGYALTAISVAELRFGILRLPSGRRREALGRAFGLVLEEDLGGRILPFDAEAAEVHASMSAAAELTGRTRPIADGQIAAICTARGLPLATRNVRDFDGQGIDLLDPWS